MSDTLDRHIKQLKNDKLDIENSNRICLQMKSDTVTYQTLNADKYLNGVLNVQEIQEFKDDCAVYANMPIRRFLARAIEDILYGSIWIIIMTIVFNKNPYTSNNPKFIMYTIPSFILSIILEAIFLKFFATTPGKWCFGLYVYDNHGKHLTFLEGIERRLKIFVYAEACWIPLLNIYCGINSYINCHYSQPNWWEYDTNIVYQKPKFYRYILIFLIPIISFIGIDGAHIFNKIPRNINNLTIQEYSQNYNNYINYYIHDTQYYSEIFYTEDFERIHYTSDYIGNYFLNDKGHWERGDYHEVVFNQPYLVFETDKDNITKISYNYARIDLEENKRINIKQIQYLMMSFVNAQIGYNPFFDDFNEFITDFESNSLTDFDVTYHNIRIQYQVEASGFKLYNEYGVLVPIENEENSIRISFTMEKLK